MVREMYNTSYWGWRRSNPNYLILFQDKYIPQVDYYLIISDSPGLPQDIFGVHLQNFRDDNDTCVISSFWRGPDNSPQAGAIDYMVNMGGNLSMVETLNIPGVEGVRLAYFSQSNCSSVNISVGATNLCGMGPMSENITLDPISCDDSSICSLIKVFRSGSPPLMSKSLIVMYSTIDAGC
jgi:hypothetical protein